MRGLLTNSRLRHQILIKDKKVAILGYGSQGHAHAA